MKGIIVGGGIGGLTLGVALNQVGIDATVYEATPEIRPVGAGILLGTNAMLVLKALGLEEKIYHAGNPLKSGAVTTQSGQILQSMPFAAMEAHFNVTTTTIHRGSLQQILIDALPTGKLVLGKKAVAVENTGTPKVHFEDGTSASGDFLVGADGIHSVVRQAIFPNIPKRYAGQTCWRGVVHFTLPEEKQRLIQEQWGKKGRFAALQIAENLVYWFAVQKTKSGGTDNKKTLKEDLLALFKDFDLAEEIILATPIDKIMRNDLYDLKPTTTWHKGKTVLVGDAIHATTPNLGQGGAQAIEDGLALARCFQKSENLEEIFTDFTKIRAPKANMIINQSKLFGSLAHLENPLVVGFRNFMLKNAPSKPFMKRMIKMYELNY